MMMKSLPVRRSSQPLQRAAFTLLEVTVALAIVGMIALALYASLNIAFKARQTAMNNLTNVRQARLAMEMIGRDLQTAVPPTGILAGAFYALPNDTGFELDTLDFFNAAPPGPAVVGAADIQRVTLTVISTQDAAAAASANEVDTVDPRDQGPRLEPQAADSQVGQQVLVRKVTRRLLAQVTPEPSTEIIVRNVRTFRVRLYDGLGWTDTWDSTTVDNTLPYAVEVTLVIDPVAGDGSARRAATPYTLVRVFSIHAAAPASGTGQISLLTPENRWP